jgi:hypothetical protein
MTMWYLLFPLLKPYLHEVYTLADTSKVLILGS